MTKDDDSLERHADLVPHFATRSEIAELREKVMSLQTILRALALRQGVDEEKIDEWALTISQYKSEPGRALATAQQAVDTLPATQRKGSGGRPIRAAANAPK